MTDNGAVSLSEQEVAGRLVLVPDEPGVVFTTRVGGRSSPPFEGLNLSYETGDDPAAVGQNRKAVSSALRISSEWVTGHQLHRARVLVAEPGMAGARPPRPPGDAVVTYHAALPVAVLVADCVPIALVGSSGVAAVHAGWRGMCAGVIEAAAAQMDGKARAWIGPSIGPCHYEVGPEVLEQFRLTHPGSEDLFTKVGGILRLDLRAAARWLLASAGVEVAGRGEPPCTFCDRRFYSYRRDGVTGRQALIVWRR